MSFLSWSSKKEMSPLTTVQASTMLKTLGTIDKEQIAQYKLSFCETDIAWMTSSGTVRSLWSALNTINASSWSCDLSMLPKLADRITQVYTTELDKINTSQQAAETISLFADAIVGLDTLNACHYNTQEGKSQLVRLAVDSLVQLRDQISVKKEALLRQEVHVAVVAEPAPEVLTPIQKLQRDYDTFRERYLALKSRVVKASQGGKNFTTTSQFASSVMHLDEKQIEQQLPAPIPGDADFTKLREKFRVLIILDMRLVIEGAGYGITR